MKVPHRIARRKLKVLKSELQMLQKYKTETSLLFDEYKKEYTSDISFLEEKLVSIKDEAEDRSPEGETEDSLRLDSQGDQEWKKTEDGWEKTDSSNSSEESQHEPEESDKPQPPAWAKKLYRKIALISHPDRMSEDFPKEKLKKIFLETADAMSEGDFEKLLGFALELGIEEEEDDISMLPLLKKRIDDLKLEIRGIESSPEWLWGEGLGLPEIRVALAMRFFNQRGVDLNMEELADIIQEMENRSDAESRDQ